jgi:16S rRNA (guanine527-N7)-methyltransferase
MFAPSPALHAALDRAQRYGAIGPSALSEHVAHAAAFVEAWESVGADPHSVLDLGSGGGLPGLVIAERRPTLECTLLDGRTERIRLLDEALDSLGWSGRVHTVAARAEVAAHEEEFRHRFDVVVARSFAGPPVTAECAAGFLRVGGLLVVSEPPRDEQEVLRWPAAGCAKLGLEVLARPELSRSFAVLRAFTPCEERFPRRVGVPAKRPMF